jgi:SAM-dependent methyltransferase
MPDEDNVTAQPFLEAYDNVRREEKWGGDDLDLPFHPLRHRDIWDVRQRTFRVFESIVAGLERGLALDIGAGSCWMTRYLDRWGFDAIAVDININEVDGLRAGQKFIDGGSQFLRVRAPIERLPFPAGRIKLIASNASFHYARDFRAALSEFERVLAPGGMIAIIDSPFYENASDGETMLAERVAEFRRKYEMPEALARRSRYFTFTGFATLAGSLNLTSRVYPVWPGLRRSYEQVRARLTGRRLAQFPVIVLEKASPSGRGRRDSAG